MANGNDVNKVLSLYHFDEFQNNRNVNSARDGMNKLKANVFLMIGVTSTGNFSIHSQLQPEHLKELLEKVIKSLPDGKPIVSLDGV